MTNQEEARIARLAASMDNATADDAGMAVSPGKSTCCNARISDDHGEGVPRCNCCGTSFRSF